MSNKFSEKDLANFRKILSPNQNEVIGIGGQVFAILEATRHIQNSLNAVSKGPNPYKPLVIGYALSITILQSFAAELALKALYKKITGKAKRGHDLHKLFCSLDSEMQESLDSRFQCIIEQKDTYTGPPTIKEVLCIHKDEFVNWRYVFEYQPLSTNLSDLEPVIEAILKILTDQIAKSLSLRSPLMSLPPEIMDSLSPEVLNFLGNYLES